MTPGVLQVGLPARFAERCDGMTGRRGCVKKPVARCGPLSSRRAYCWPAAPGSLLDPSGPGARMVECLNLARRPVDPLIAQDAVKSLRPGETVLGDGSVARLWV